MKTSCSGSVVPRPLLLRRDLAGEDWAGSDGEKGRSGKPTEGEARPVLPGPG